MVESGRKWSRDVGWWWRLWRKWSCCCSALEIVGYAVLLLLQQRDVAWWRVWRKWSRDVGWWWRLWRKWSCCCSALEIVGYAVLLLLQQRDVACATWHGGAASTELLPFEVVERKSSAQPGAADSPPPTDVPMMCYASGTVGDPKRVVLLQRNLTYAALGQQQAHDLHDEVQISYLPMVHVLERVVLVLMFLNGASVGVYHGDLRLLMNDIAALQPTVLVTVPRLVSGVYDTQGVDAVGGWADLESDLRPGHRVEAGRRGAGADCNAGGTPGSSTDTLNQIMPETPGAATPPPTTAIESPAPIATPAGPTGGSTPVARRRRRR
ncbi:hypothetical protein PR003_g22742 [Phytophthora rubi]|uniref:AMP-dependent synthetase/ligase domain-containing protein n=1 Tax=Phytophthora rubi TaxID=129364 RepID=A0A6A4D310_9STRA|nr:hypothetical protein PR003_g22742 [Phytophthora rubi]